VITIDARTDHLALAERYAAAPDQWPVAPRFNPGRRWYHRIAQAADHEVWLLTWLPGQCTDLHDHGGSAGAFHVLSGSLTEDTALSARPTEHTALSARPTEHTTLSARPTEHTTLSGRLIEDTAVAGMPVRITAREFGEGAGRRFGCRHIHRIANRSMRPAISVHVYAPALTTMTRYRIGASRLEVADLEKAGVQW
jgi:hypothetical protein